LFLAIALRGGKKTRAAGIRGWALRAPEHEPADAGALLRQRQHASSRAGGDGNAEMEHEDVQRQPIQRVQRRGGCQLRKTSSRPLRLLRPPAPRPGRQPRDRHAPLLRA